MKEEYNKTLEKVVILEFLDKRPFKESNLTIRDNYLERMLCNVNSKIVAELKTNYTFKSKSQLVGFHDDVIANFVNTYEKSYKDLSTKIIEGSDRVMLEAMKVHEEDLKTSMMNKFYN